MSSVTRRHFIRMTGAGLLVAHSPFSLALGGPQSRKKLGVALLGLGNYSANLLAPALQHTEHCELRGIITGTESKISKWQRKYGIQDSNVYTYDTMDEIANNKDIDVIYVVTPTGTHKDFAVKAANTGKHVWCEKPMAMDSDECQAIIDACNKNGVTLSIGYRMQHEPNTRTFHHYLESMPYGKFKKVSSFAGYAGQGRDASNWRMQQHMGGGALYDMGVYAINSARFLTGKEPLSVTGSHPPQRFPNKFTQVDETTMFTMDFGHGLMADCGTSVVTEFNHFKAECEQGWYQLKPMQSYNGVTGTTSDGEKFEPIKGMQQTLQMDNDALAILTDRQPLVTGSEGLADIRIVNAIFRAAQTGKAVAV